MMWLKASLAAFVLFCASCGMSHSKRTVVQEELWNFKDAEEHIDKDTSQQMLAMYQERLTSSAVRIDRAGDPINKADVAISMQARWCAKDLDCLAAAKTLGSDNLSPAEQKENDGQKQRCLESFTRDLVELKRMAQ
jgi:hypothetical protein